MYYADCRLVFFMNMVCCVRIMSRHTCGVLISFKMETVYAQLCFQSPNPQKGTQKKIIELPLQLQQD